MKEVIRAVRGRSFPALHGCWSSFCEQDRSTPSFVLSFVEKIKITLPLTYLEPYLGDTTGRRGDGLASSVSSYHEINTIANGPYQYYFLLCTPRVIGKKTKFRILEIFWALASLPSYISLYIT